MIAFETDHLAKHFGGTAALDGCTVSVPSGHVVALVGPNGAGKTTLLNVMTGLVRPTSGSISVLGGLVPGSPEALASVAYVAQDAPLPRHLSVAAALDFAGYLNPVFDQRFAIHRLDDLGIPLRRRVGRLSGGQQAQVALTIAIARRPRLLVLDEPLASLDPLARHDLMALILAIAADDGLTVVFSSHVISELEQVADYLVLLRAGRVQVAGPIDELLTGHAVLDAAIEIPGRPSGIDVVETKRAGRHTQLIVRGVGDFEPDGWERHAVGLDELVLAYLRESTAPTLVVGAVAVNADRSEEAGR